MTRYTYSRLTLHPVTYLVRYTSVYYATNGEQGRIGEVWREGRDPAWYARLYTDPSIQGTGRTRDDAVDDCYEQVGGPD